MKIALVILSRIAEAYRNAGLFASLVLGALSVLDLPGVFIHEGWQRLWHEQHRRTAAEVLFITWFVLNLAALQMIEARPVAIILPAIRLADILYTRVFLLIRAIAPQSSARSILLLLAHYIEVVVIYACVYIWLGAHYNKGMFLMAGHAVKLSPTTAFYFSLMTATTVGYGDITPDVSALSASQWLAPSAMVGAELMTVLFIVAIEVPRVFFSFGTKLKVEQSNRSSVSAPISGAPCHQNAPQTSPPPPLPQLPVPPDWPKDP